MSPRNIKKRQKNVIAQHRLQAAGRLKMENAEDLRFQRALAHWLATADDKSKHGIEMHLSETMRMDFQLRIAGTTDSIQLTCSRHDVSVWAIQDEHTDDCDLLADWIVAPQRTRSGWVNRCKLPQYQTPCNTLQALWRQVD